MNKLEFLAICLLMSGGEGIVNYLFKVLFGV